jgi:hypothetical protein
MFIDKADVESIEKIDICLRVLRRFTIHKYNQFQLVLLYANDDLTEKVYSTAKNIKTTQSFQSRR